THARTEVRWAVERLRLVGRGSQDALAHLGDIAAAEALLVSARARLVVAARRQGATWDQIGTALGVSRQAAASAYARKVALILDRERWHNEFPGGLPAVLVRRFAARERRKRS
ncbi:hypothetical protein, partial [Nocardioides sp.]|uniref:hypothetical protein n=1 Tax=Nocardioides sp. TaxID=35761 RepID=UPI0026368D93